MLHNDYLEIDILVEKVKWHDTDALWVLYDYYKPIIFSYCKELSAKYSFICSEDLQSECVFILKDLCEKYDKDKSYFSYYLTTRLKPYLVSKIKSSYLEKIPTVKLYEIEALSYEIEFEFENYSQLNNALEKLSEQHRKVVDLFYFQNLTQSECALILGISQPAFNKKLKKILDILKKEL
jgi:RNA polymerase sigma factor (sigma-70 family)